MWSNINRHECRGKILQLHPAFPERHRRHIEPDFHAGADLLPLTSHITPRRRHNLPLFGSIDSLLGPALDWYHPALDFYKMYSIARQGDHVYLQMPAPPIPLQYGMSLTDKVHAGLILAPPPELASAFHVVKFFCQCFCQCRFASSFVECHDSHSRTSQLYALVFRRFYTRCRFQESLDFVSQGSCSLAVYYSH